MNFITNKIEEKIGFDINGDHRVGGSSAPEQVGQATHMDLNHGGVGGGHKAAGGGGGLMDKAEQLTHMDLNNDGRVGGRAAQQKH